jgi:DDE superfamily endonuclease
VVVFRRRTRRRAGAEWWQAVVDTPPTGTISIAGDNADTHGDDEVEAVGRAAAGRLVRLSWPTDRPWLNPMERLWRQCRRDVTHGDLGIRRAALLQAAQDVFDRHHRCPARVLSIIGAQAA